jgi:hypothetical protein
MVKGLINGFFLGKWKKLVFFLINHNLIVWWKFSKKFKNFLRNFVQIPRIFQNKHPINSHPKGLGVVHDILFEPLWIFWKLDGNTLGKKNQKNSKVR